MKISDLTSEQLNGMVDALQNLVDGQFKYVYDVVAVTGLSDSEALRVKNAIDLLMALHP